MYIARKITHSSKFLSWTYYDPFPFASDSDQLDEFSEVIDWDENLRALKRRVYNRFHGYFDKVLIFRDTTLVSWRNMAFDKRWHKWFEK